jgi:hypothetical protein
VIIELIGAPGAGKTSLAPALIASFAERGVAVRGVVEAARPFAERSPLGAAATRLAPARLRRPLLWQAFCQASALYRLRFFARHPRLIAHVLRAQRRRPIPIEERLHALRWFIVLAGQYEFLKAHARPGEGLIFDEGFIHRAVQMYASDREIPDRAQVAAYVDLLPQPDLLCAVRAPQERCIERVYRRGLWHRFRHKRRDQVERYITNAHQIVDMAVDRARGRGWRVVEVDNGGDDIGPAEMALRERLDSVDIHERGAAVLRSAVEGGRLWLR